MKLLPLFSLLAITYAAPVAEELVAESVSDAGAEKPSVNSNAQGVKILPRFDQEKAKDGATRTPISYGEYSVTSAKMLQVTKIAKGPCPPGGCFVTAMQATIRYPDKTEANIDTNAWLHHIALFGTGTGSGSIWACGNERPTLRLNTEHKYGIDFPTAFMLMIDLMTESLAPKKLTLEITYEWLPKDLKNGYKGATMYWLTIGEPAAKSGVYSFSSQSQTASSSGQLLYAIGHMHDGGTDMRLYVNRKLVCKSVMHYNLRPGYTLPGGAGGMAGMSHGGHSRAINTSEAPSDGIPGAGTEHISDPGACTSFGSVNRGDSLYSEAWYDAIQHPLMVHNGKKENLMGNMRVYIGG